MMDVLCFCEIVVKGGTPFNGNPPLVPTAACHAAGTDIAKKAAYNSCIIGGIPPLPAPGNPPLAPGVETLSCPITALAADATTCAPAGHGTKSLFDTFKCA